ncbi:MAG: hypothetical protein LBM75_03305 [Myxococcales bacterium]|jgi:DNA-damage-inducible protein D|nr:hypothetical protein [Myxococcales bacterium]
MTIEAKDFVNEITNAQIQQQGLRGDPDISKEHVTNDHDVRKLLTKRDILPEALPAAEEVKKLER